MIILIEGEVYPIEYLQKTFNSNLFYDHRGYEGVITQVGYYHNLIANKLIFILPKVFTLGNGQTVFGLNKNELIEAFENKSITNEPSLIWLRNISIYLYMSLLKYKKKFSNSKLINYSTVFQLKGIPKTIQYSYLDILLSFVSFYKKNRNFILFKHIEALQANPKRTNWTKTVRKGKPIILNGTPFYDRVRVRNKVRNTEEELITCFFSILNYFEEQHSLGIKIEKIYPIVKGNKFEDLRKKGLKKLKKIKYKYFSDTLKEMHALCSLFFTNNEDRGKGITKEDFISVNNYNIIFEDMIDNLFSDELKEDSQLPISLKDLKYHKDGKIIDHIFNYTSLVDDSNIFYIGDSKYYKPGNEAGDDSKFKQFTYAKNVIQYNIDLLNQSNEQENIEQRYRDSLTEGYNITPNFFIYGYIDDFQDYKSDNLQPQGDVKSSYHFNYRLFDRDTLFIHQYKINFLFVLKSYISYKASSIREFRNKVRVLFKSEFLKYFETNGKSGYSFYKLKDELNREKDKKQDFVFQHFRRLNGKIYNTSNEKLILAIHEKDNSLIDILNFFEEYNLSQK